MPLLPKVRRRVGALIDRNARLSARILRGQGKVRNDLAERYLHGEGIEIGALHKPLPLPRDAHARYVDRMSADDLRRHYPELAGWKLIDPDIVDDGEKLTKLDADSVDFVIANHFIEHTEDPIAAIAAHLRVLRPGGVLFMAAPDKQHTFDRERAVTTIDHMARDHREGPETSRAEHYEDWSRHVDKADDVEGHARDLLDQSYSIHFHVFTLDSFQELLEHARSAEGLPFTVEEALQNGEEFVVVLRKTA